MKIFFSSSLIILFTLALGSCASTPAFDTTNVDLSITPQRATAEAPKLTGTALLWGGIIINSQNLKDETQFEVLAYPLDSNQKPDIDRKPLGRFLAIQNGYTETSDYSQGRLVTISGTLTEIRKGRVGETEYEYPTLELTKIHLWRYRRERSDTQFHFGIGLIFSN